MSINEYKTKRIEDFVSLFFLVITVLLVGFSLKSNPFSNYLHGHDSSMFLYFGKGLSKGLVPYTDMFDHKGPVLFFIQYLATFLGNNISIGIWLIEVIFFSMTLFFVYKTCLLFVKEPVYASVGILFNVGLIIRCFEGGNLSEQYALLFIAIAFYLFNKLIQEGRLSSFEYISIGVSGALVFFIRVNMVGLWVVYCLYLLVNGLMKKEKKELLRQLLYIFTGGISVVLVLCLYGILTNSLGEMIQQAFVMNFKYSSVSLTEKVVASKKFIELLNVASIIVVCTIYVIYLMTLNKKMVDFKQGLLILLYFGLNFLTVVVSGRFYLHYLTTQLVVIILITAQSLYFIAQRVENHKMRTLVPFVLLMFTFLFNLETFNKYTKIINFQVSLEKAYVNEVADFIVNNTGKDDTIYVHNSSANLYLLTERFSNSRFFVLPSLDYRKFPDLSEEFLDQLEKTPPKMVIVKKDFNEDTENQANLNFQVKQVLDQHYEEVKMSKKEGAYLLYQYVSSSN